MVVNVLILNNSNNILQVEKSSVDVLALRYRHTKNA